MPETKMEKERMAACGYCDANHHSPMRRLIKTLIGAFIVMLVLLIGIGVGHRATYNGSYGFGMMSQGRPPMWGSAALPANMMYLRANGAGVNQGLPVWTQPVNAGKPTQQGTRVAGVISAITGTEITLVDNGGKTQKVSSDSGTVITSAKGEIPLSALKAKQYIVCYVTLAGGKNTALSIQLP